MFACNYNLISLANKFVLAILDWSVDSLNCVVHFPESSRSEMKEKYNLACQFCPSVLKNRDTFKVHIQR